MKDRQWGVHPGANPQDGGSSAGSHAVVVWSRDPSGRAAFERAADAEDVMPEAAGSKATAGRAERPAGPSLLARLRRPGLYAAGLALVFGLGWYGMAQVVSEGPKTTATAPVEPAPTPSSAPAAAPGGDKSVRVVGTPGAAPSASVSAPAASASAPAAAPKPIEERVTALNESVARTEQNTAATLTRLQERLDRAERTNGELVAQVARLQERLDRGERPVASASSGAVPGSAGFGSPRVAAPVPDAPAAEIAPAPRGPVADEGAAPATNNSMSTASVMPSGPVPPGSIPSGGPGRGAPNLSGWVIRDVYRGVALVQGRTGLFEVAPGQNLPGAGRVESIQRRGRDWVVVTNRGIISANDLN